MRTFRDFILETTGLIAFCYDDVDTDANAEEWIRENICDYVNSLPNRECKTMRLSFTDNIDDMDKREFDEAAYGAVKAAIQYVNDSVGTTTDHPVLIIDYRSVADAVKRFAEKENIEIPDDDAFRRMLPKYADEVVYSLASQQEFFENNNTTVILLDPWHYNSETGNFNSAMFAEGCIDEVVPTIVSFNTPFFSVDDMNTIAFIKHKDVDVNKTVVYERL